MIKIAVFASGSGSNFQAIVDSIQKGELEAELSLLVCDKPEAKVVERAQEANINTLVLSPKGYKDKAAYEAAILQQLREHNVEFLVLAGYMRLIGDVLLEAFSNRIVNLHPSILPSFPGKDAVGQALEAGVRLTGITIHYVDEGMDTGPIIAQFSVPIHENDEREQVEERIHALEHEFYPKTLQELFQRIYVRNLD